MVVCTVFTTILYLFYRPTVLLRTLINISLAIKLPYRICDYSSIELTGHSSSSLEQYSIARSIDNAESFSIRVASAAFFCCCSPWRQYAVRKDSREDVGKTTQVLGETT